MPKKKIRRLSEIVYRQACLPIQPQSQLSVYSSLLQICFQLSSLAESHVTRLPFKTRPTKSHLDRCNWIKRSLIQWSDPETPIATVPEAEVWDFPRHGGRRDRSGRNKATGALERVFSRRLPHVRINTSMYCVGWLSATKVYTQEVGRPQRQPRIDEKATLTLTHSFTQIPKVTLPQWRLWDAWQCLVTPASWITSILGS